MKRESQLVKIEDFYRRCLQEKEPRLGQLVSKRGGRIRRRRRIVGGRNQPPLWDRLSQNVPMEDVQYLAGHSSPRTTQVYDRRRRRVARTIVERISV